MRVADLAALAGTTTRTVRHYHALGLLPVPAERGGWRDYDLSHVARLSRIRWLVQAGVPLRSVRTVLAASPGPRVPIGGSRGSGADADPPGTAPVVVELASALSAAEQHLHEVTRQRDMLVALLDRARSGHTVSPMPTRMVAFYDRLEASAPDDRTRAAVRRERDVADLACYRGDMPPGAEWLFPDPSPESDAQALAAFGRSLEELSDDEVDELAQANVARIVDRLGTTAVTLARQVEPEAIQRVFALMIRAEPAYRRLGAAMEGRMIEAVKRLRRSSPSVASGPSV